ncbi:hypothetical protein JCM19235_3274 [Vibrio maritimus]|uniref:Uncharacterized protein n=1 Tax=Vibrio maritimus TaxID=990268 RepID=A0A090S7L7_9VIBR|nr:hypothetical protein JCM19235_3274 [Vibrio maritimus]
MSGKIDNQLFSLMSMHWIMSRVLNVTLVSCSLKMANTALF